MLFGKDFKNMEFLNQGNPFLSVLVPCYRDEEGLGELHRRLTVVCKGLGKFL
jgi:hypothetical protein